MFGQGGKINSWWLLPGAIIFFIIAVLLLGNAFLEWRYDKKIYPGVSLGQVDLSGLDFVSAQKKVNDLSRDLESGLVFSFNNQEIRLANVSNKVSPDSAFSLYTVNSQEAMDKVINFGRSGNYLRQLYARYYGLIFGWNFKLAINDFNGEEIKKQLKNNFSNFDQPAHDAKLVINNLNPLDYKIETENKGQVLDYDSAISELEKKLVIADQEKIILKQKIELPKVLVNDCANLKPQIETLLALAPLTLNYQDQKWQIKKNELVKLLSLEKKQDNVVVVLDNELTKKYLTEKIAPILNQPARQAKYEIQNGKTRVIQMGADGLELDLEATVDWLKNMTAEGQNNIELPVKIIKNTETVNELTDWGIKELVGSGTSDFKGSPANRQHNIKTGMSAINGVIIDPDEEFSLIKTLGDVSRKTGYLPELVIKENKTIPEYGGGLCQVGTTMFRVALNAGLPITMRRNHSYRVSYYEPAGTDATIYSPFPDLRFINDTGQHLLIQTKMTGTILTFELWGTKDGRQVSVGKPKIFNIVNPPATKIVETTDLKPGEKKCTEKAHKGADAYFDYKVIYPNGETKEKRFSSHYVPWQEVCLVGVEKLSQESGVESPVSAEATASKQDTVIIKQE